MKLEALSFFKKLFQATYLCNPQSLQLQCIPKISKELYDSLMQIVSMKEVKDAVFSMSPYKAPGPDGFQPVFFRNYWHIVGNDVWNVIANTFSTGTIAQNLTETLIVPFPKTDAPTGFRDFRPISLCNVLLKLISKILV